MNLSERITNPLDDMDIMKALIEIPFSREFYYWRLIYFRSIKSGLIDKGLDDAETQAQAKAKNEFFSFIFNKMKKILYQQKIH